MLKINLLIALLCLPTFSFACTETELQFPEYHVFGDAYDSNGNLIYIEELRYVNDDNPDHGVLQTTYRLPDQTELAVKEVTFDCTPTSPGFVLINSSNGETEGVQWLTNLLRVKSFQPSTEKEIDAPNEVISINAIVIDAGFDHFIKLNWDSLIDGEPIQFHYLFARDNKFLKLRIEKTNAPESQRIIPNQEEVFFKISANNLLFRWLSNPIFVGYNIPTKSLRYYNGPSNLPMMKKKKDILIAYREALL